MSIKEIAKLAGVSVASVSRVINNNPHVKAATKRKVQDAIKKSDYTPNLVGRTLRTQRNNKILVLVPDISNPFFSKILKGMESVANNHGYALLLAITNQNPETEKKYLRMLSTKQVDGIVSFLSNIDLTTFKSIVGNRPVVQCCEPIEGAKYPCVRIENKVAAFEAVSYLITKGRKNIAMLIGSFYAHSEQARKEGYMKALNNASIPFQEKLMQTVCYDYDSARLGMDELFERCKNIDAVFCCSDTMAVGAELSILNKGKQPGIDIDVIGFDNSAISRIFLPTITTVSQPRYEIGESAISLILDKIENTNSLDKLIILPHKLILRQSTGD